MRRQFFIGDGTLECCSVTLKKNLTLSQFIRCCVVGFIQNSAGYLLYILLTSVGLSPQVAVSICYPLGMALSFWGNKHFSFKSQANTQRELVRYILSHVCAYLTNIFMLFLFVDNWAFDHRIVQLFLVAFNVLYFFIAYKFFVFKK